MFKDIENSRLLTRPLKVSPLQQQYKTDNLGIQIKHPTLKHKNILSIKLQQALPQIISPYLKKTINSMFSHQKLRQLEPTIQEMSTKQKNRFQTELVKNITQSIKTDNIIYLKAREQKNRELKIETKIFNSEHLVPNKILKNYSQSRKHEQFLDLGLIDLKKSLELRQNVQNKSKQKSRKKSRAHTQQSQHNQQTSKVILKKLQQLHQKESHINFSPTDKQSAFVKPLNKELKSGFVMRQKLSREMYGQQRQQLKIVNQLLESQKGLNLSKGIKVKNYTKFLPKIISIED